MATKQSQNMESTNKSAEENEWKVDYTLKKHLILDVGDEGDANDELCYPAGLALDESNQLIYVADTSNSRVQVVTFEGIFICSFGQDILKEPFGIVLTEDHVFVTDTELHALFKFSDNKLVRTGTEGNGDGELDEPHGLCIDYNTDIFVADSNNNRICVFSKDLKFLKIFTTQQLKCPRDVKVTTNSIVVLDWSADCVHFYTRSGDHARSCISHGDDYGMVRGPWLFCLDPVGNLLITDTNNDNIKIFSPSGNLIHTLETIESEVEEDNYLDIENPFGICISRVGIIFITSFESEACLQSF